MARTALVTGSSSGFGLLTCVELARRGFRVLATMRNPARSGRLDAALAEAGQTAETIQLDVSDAASIDAAVRAAGAVDVLVNNAGYGIVGFAEDLTVDEYREQFETNFFGLVALCKAFIPQMRERRSGRIINVTSLNGHVGVPNLSAYCASKFAVEGFSESLRHELLPHGVFVTCVAPGTFKTDIFDRNKRRAAALDDGTSPHLALAEKLEQFGVDYANRNGADPRAVAVAIARAATARRPALHYFVGVDARLGKTARTVLPMRTLEIATGLLMRK
jgi:NAD(P)-dependent dehydrogenase (short-subunit alcohol dehydrogenase family)